MYEPIIFHMSLYASSFVVDFIYKNTKFVFGSAGSPQNKMNLLNGNSFPCGKQTTSNSITCYRAHIYCVNLSLLR